MNGQVRVEASYKEGNEGIFFGGGTEGGVWGLK